MWTWIKERFSEKSTYATIFTVLATVLGVNIAPELQEAITGVGLSLLTLIGILVKER